MKPRRHGFTMVELLVTLAIIALLASLLLPVVRSSQVKARSAESLGKLRQLMAAVTLYAGEHDGRFPYGDGYQAALTPYLHNPLQARSVFVSANADRQPIEYATTQAHIPITYSIHGWLSDDGNGRGRPLTVMADPSRIIVFADGNQNPNNYWQANWRFENPRALVMESRRSDFDADTLRSFVTDLGPDEASANAGWFRYCNNGAVACAFGDGHAALIEKGAVRIENLTP